MVLESPETYVGSTLILGGQIIETVNRPNDTLMTVLEIPLDHSEMPREEVRSRGRFIAKLRGYMDPEIYRRGRRITLAGEVIGKAIKPLGELEYAYPVLLARELHIWRNRYVEYRVPLYYWDWYWYPYYGPRYGLGFHYW
jgi:outer membrane lipoprotein